MTNQYIAPGLNTVQLSDGDISPVLSIMRAVSNVRYFTQIVVTGSTIQPGAEVTDLYTRSNTKARFRGDVYGTVKWVKAVTSNMTRNRSQDNAVENYFLARRVVNRLGAGESGPVFEVIIPGTASVAQGEVVPVVYDEDGVAICLRA